MAVNDVNIHPGMHVYGSDSQEIGTVADIYPQIQLDQELPVSERVREVEVEDTAPSYGPSSPEGYRAAGPASEKMTGDASSAMMPHYYDVEPEPESVRTVADTMYMRVDHGGVLGFGVESLYIPFTAVEQVVPGDRVVIRCRRDEAADLYGQKPEFLAGH
ncbi:MAG TPA: hypothetical protein VFB58_15210 [Chloroflexota bacterium]|nr:hypothetical protein [Chloroflexota bacterium]